MAALIVGTSAVAVPEVDNGANVLIQNLGAADIFVGTDNTVSVSSGVRIKSSGGHLIITGRRDRCPKIWLISGTAGQDVRWQAL